MTTAAMTFGRSATRGGGLRIDAVRQLHPQHIAPLWRVQLGAAGQPALHPFHHLLHLVGAGPAQAADVAVTAMAQPYAAFFAVEEYDLSHCRFDGGETGTIRPFAST